MSATTMTGHLIGNDWVQNGDGEFQSVSPSDDSCVWRGPPATVEQVSQATAAAREALSSWWDQPLEARKQYAVRYAEIVQDQKDELARLISHEMGKPLWEAKTEAGAVVGKAALAIDAIEQRRPESSFEMGEASAVTRYKPFGVLGVVGPFNFPAHLPNGHIIPAIIAGNTVVFKPSEQTPAVGQWMIQRWQEAGLPPGVVNLVQGARDTGIALANDPQLDGLLFTGSSAAGKALHKTFGQWPQKMLALEMGGNNPLIVHRTNDVRAAAYQIILSAYITAGQRCTCARRLIVTEDEADAIVEAVVEMIQGVTTGLWTSDPEPFLGTVVSKSMGRRLLDEQSELIDRGAKAIVSMTHVNGHEALVSPGLLDSTNVANRSDEEVFGPLLQVFRVRSFEEAIAEANNTSYGLSAGLISSSRDLYDQFIHQIRAGVVNWNRQTTGASGKLAFGGCGLSGNNRPSGYFASDYCNWPVASLEAENLELPETPMTGITL